MLLILIKSIRKLQNHISSSQELEMHVQTAYSECLQQLNHMCLSDSHVTMR